MRSNQAKIISFVFLGLFCCAFVSSNVPIRHWSYHAIDKLAGYGLIESDLLATRPISRLEMARLIAEAMENADQLSEKNEIVLSLIDKLKAEFSDELAAIGATSDGSYDNFFKPVEDPYFKYVYANKQTGLENIRGDIYEKDHNYRVGFDSRIKLFNRFAFFLHPEYVDSSTNPDKDVELVEGYGKVMFGPIEVQIGKDSLFWGPGYNGSLIMTNNVEPFKMIKVSNPKPIQLPWIFRSFGPCKVVWFITELESDRAIPDAKLSGLRVNFKPNPDLELGFSRVIQFGGKGAPHVGIMDYIEMWKFQAEQQENNQLAGFDVSLRIPFKPDKPLRALKLYGEFIGEDEASGAPSAWGKLFGAQLNDLFRNGSTDLVIEYTDNHVSGKPNVFYNHSLYQSGYTYKGRIVGHHMGTDSRDLFLRLTHYISKDLILGLEYNREKSNISSSPKPVTEKYDFSLTFFNTQSWHVITGYRYEHAKNYNLTRGNIDNNHIYYLEVIRDF